MKRTYGGRRGTGAGPIGYHDLLQSVDSSSTIFDALSIKNLKQLKRDTNCSYATWSNQQRSGRTCRKKLAKRTRRVDISALVSVVENSVEKPTESCLTPDKSLRVNRALDPFDQLRESPHDRKDDDIFSQLLNSSTDNSTRCSQNMKHEVYAKLSANNSQNESHHSTDAVKENNQNDINVTAKKDDLIHNLTNSDLHKYNLNIEEVNCNDILSTSTKGVDNNFSIIQAISIRKLSIDKNSPKRYIISHNTLTPNKQPEPLTSTPYLKKYNEIYAMNVSPIQNRSRLPKISVIGESLLCKGDLNQSKGIETSDSSKIVFNVNEAKSEKESIDLEIEHNESTTSRNTENSDKSIISVHSDIDGEPFLGFTNIPVLNDSQVSKRNTSNYSFSGMYQMNDESANSDSKSANKSQSSLSFTESTNSSESYNTCSSTGKSKEGDFNECNYANPHMKRTEYDIKSGDSCEVNSQSSNSIDGECCSQPSTTLNLNLSDNATALNIGNISKTNVEEVRESISISSESNHSDESNNMQDRTRLSSTDLLENSTNSSISKTGDTSTILDNDNNQKMISFVTTRRRNYLDNSITILLDDSSESSTSESARKVVSDFAVACNSSINTENMLKEELGKHNEMKTETDDHNDKNKICDQSITGLTTYGNYEEEKEVRPSIVLQPGKKWERSLSIYRRQTMQQDHILHHEAVEEESSPTKSECQGSRATLSGTLYFNDSVCGRRENLLCNPRRSTIRIIKEQSTARASFSASPLLEDDIGFLSEDCDDTLAELSKLSISDTALDITVLEKRPEERHTSARDIVLRRCNQTEVLPFHECYPDSVLKNCRKIGEGVYGEVYLYRGQDGRGRVMKVVPVEGRLLVNGEHQKTFQEVISEVVIAMELSALRTPIEDIEKHCDDERDNSDIDISSVENATDTFNEVLAVRCVSGAYPARLLDLWDLYDESKGSENDTPAALPPDQLYMVLELANAGQDLESYQFNSAEQAYALFYQLIYFVFDGMQIDYSLRKVAFALAVGEEAFQLEHRDLHWGNVLIQPTDQKFARYVLGGRLHSVPRCGVAATIIDYTLSRVSLPLAAGECATLYNDLAADEGLFHAVGDYQFDIYRHMRDKTGNDWKRFEPYTNVLWLHYTVDKMITALRYKRTNTKIHKHYIAKLKGVRNRLLHYASAVQFVLTDNEI